MYVKAYLDLSLKSLVFSLVVASGPVHLEALGFLFSVAGCALFCCGFVVVCLLRDFCRNGPVRLFRVLTCTMGSAPSKWTCTASFSFFWTLTDRATLDPPVKLPGARAQKKADPTGIQDKSKRALKSVTLSF